ncbi:hypothetical protein Taro_028744, partial [Colocasia esculenta]|nr:hypothetical protein [Colocasia esculenta]
MAYQGKKLINDPNGVVTEFIEGLVETYPGLQYLDGFPQVKVVLRADVSGATYDKVAVISGGGSGHEPAHAGFVGAGMLTAAICGDIFTSPPVDSILAGIRAVTGPMGCLLIVKNYTGDRLNFGLAAEQAKSEGYKVETVIVGDDCALPPPRGLAGRRGLAGTILVHKVAGAAAATGLSLAKVAAEAKQAADMVGTMGVALSVCTLPGQVTSDRLGPGKMELGLGITFLTQGLPWADADLIWPICRNGGGLCPMMHGLVTYSLDDTLLFMTDDTQQLVDARPVLEMVLDIPGLKVNYSKSHLVAINLEEQDFMRATLIFKYQIGAFLFSYLGLPLSPGPIHCEDWQPVPDLSRDWQD